MPRFEGKFKQLLNENTIREIAQFQSQLERERRTIKDRIGQINGSLRDIPYNAGTYIRLEAINTDDAQVRVFSLGEPGSGPSRTFRFVVIDEAFGRGSDESAKYGLELFKRLGLQLFIVTPLQKIHIIEPYVAAVGFVYNEAGRNSFLRCLTIEEYRKEKAAERPQ